jgi:ABC-type antimicrobial peptide transport system permease subunit
MFEARHQDEVTIIRGVGELTKDELSAIAAIARRARELAVRIAVGASAGDVVRLITAQTVRLVAAGSILGLLLMFGLSRLVRAGGGAGSIWDPALYSFVLPVLVIGVVSALATWIPSRRAVRIDPVVLLRAP